MRPLIAVRPGQGAKGAVARGPEPRLRRDPNAPVDGARQAAPAVPASSVPQRQPIEPAPPRDLDEAYVRAGAHEAAPDTHAVAQDAPSQTSRPSRKKPHGFLRRKPVNPSIKRDPAPSRWAYRIHRIWLTPFYRVMLRIGLPVFILGAVALGYLSDPTNRNAITEKVAEIRESIESRPEFAVKLMAIEGASPVVDSAVRDLLPVQFPVSSFDLDLEAMQARVSSLDVIESVNLRVRPGGVLEVAVTEREPAVLWRTASSLEMLDGTGHRVASVTERAARPELPLIAGKGAETKVREALALFDASGPITPRIRGLVRVGERRWDIVLDRNQTIQLPEIAPVAALEQVLALEEAQDMLARDITTVDMRNPARPTLRMTDTAVASLRDIRSQTTGASPR